MLRGERPDLVEPLLPPEESGFVLKARCALDAYVRHHRVTVPRNAVAHIHEHLAEAAFEMMERNMDAELA